MPDFKAFASKLQQKKKSEGGTPQTMVDSAVRNAAQSVTSNNRDPDAVVLMLSQIEVRDQIRRHFTNIDELALDILRNGQHTPVVVKQLADNQFLLQAGGRRFAAKSLLRDWYLENPDNPIFAGTDIALSYATIAARISRGSRVLLQLSENVQREELTPIEEALAIKQAWDEEYSECSQEELGRELHMSQSRISRRLSLLEADPVIQQALDQSVITPKRFLDAKSRDSVPELIQLLNDGYTDDNWPEPQPSAQAPGKTTAKGKGKSKGKKPAQRFTLERAQVDMLVDILSALAARYDIAYIPPSAELTRKDVMAVISDHLEPIHTEVRRENPDSST
jgi:ParB family chromosome partitioning protein